MRRVVFPVLISAALLSLAGCAPSAGPAGGTEPGAPLGTAAEFTCDDVLELTAMAGGDVEGISAGSPAELPGGGWTALPPAICFLVEDEPTENMSVGRQPGLWYEATGYYAESQSADLVAGLTAAGYAPWVDDDSFWYPADLDPNQEAVDGEVVVADPAPTVLLPDMSLSEQKYIVITIGVKAD